MVRESVFEDHSRLEWHTCGPASILEQRSTHGPEQGGQFLSVYGLLEKESGADRKCLLHGLSVITASHNNNWSGFVPGRLADQGAQDRSHAGVASLGPGRSHQTFPDWTRKDALSAIADGTDLRLKRLENFSHQFQACDVIFHDEAVSGMPCVYLFYFGRPWRPESRTNHDTSDDQSRRYYGFRPARSR